MGVSSAARSAMRAAEEVWLTVNYFLHFICLYKSDNFELCKAEARLRQEQLNLAAALALAEAVSGRLLVDG